MPCAPMVQQHTLRNTFTAGTMRRRFLRERVTGYDATRNLTRLHVAGAVSLLEGRRVLRVPSLRLPSSFIMALDARDFLTRITAAHMYV